MEVGCRVVIYLLSQKCASCVLPFVCNSAENHMFVFLAIFESNALSAGGMRACTSLEATSQGLGFNGAQVFEALAVSSLVSHGAHFHSSPTALVR